MKAKQLIIAIIGRVILYFVALPFVVPALLFITFSTTPEFTPTDPILGYNYIIRRSTGMHAKYATINLPDFIEEGRYGSYYVIDIKQPPKAMYEIVTEKQTFEDINIMQTAKGETLVIMHGSKTEGRLGGNYQVGTRLNKLAESGLIDIQSEIIVATCYPGNQEIYSHCDARMYSEQHHGIVSVFKFNNKVILVEVPELISEVFTYVWSFFC